MTFKVPEQFRFIDHLHPLGSTSAFGNNGAFELTLSNKTKAFAIAGDGLGWEHVSVSVLPQTRCPTWAEMCEVKDLFWGEDDCVMQYHPPKSDYVNNHPYVLHLWKPIGKSVQRPPKFMV